MPLEITLVRCQDGSLRPATAHDQELLGKWKIGQAVRVEATQVKPRSLQHHKLYWGGLLGLAYDYWEPTGGLVSPSEVATLRKFSRWLDGKGGNSGAITRACRAFLAELRDRRAQHIEAPEKTLEALHRFVKEESGYYDLVMTPRGVVRQVRSINFNAMDGDEFAEFYKAAFSVVWRFILSRTFASETEAENAINQLIALG